MSTEFTDSKCNQICTRFATEKGHALQLAVSWEEFEQHEWLRSETGDCVKRTELLECVNFVRTKISFDEVIARLTKDD